MKTYVLKFTLISLFLCFSSTNLFANIYYVTNVNDSGAGSLRQAITDANAHVWLDTIYFNILQGSAPYIIHPVTIYPDITSPVLIDGFSQPFNNDTTYSVIIDGSLITSTANVFTLSSPYCEIKGLRFTNFSSRMFSLICNSLFVPHTLHNINFSKNLFTNATGIGIEIPDFSNSYDSIYTISIDSNIYINVGTCFSANYWEFSQIQDLKITNNEVDSSGGFAFSSNGTGSYINSLTNLSFKNNTFRRAIEPLHIDLGGTGNFSTSLSKINISENYFYNTQFGSVIDFYIDGTGNATLSEDSILIENNTVETNVTSFISSGFLFSINGTGYFINTLKNLNIAHNYFHNTSGNILDFSFSGTGGAYLTEDSIIVDSNSIKSNDPTIGNYSSGISIEADGTGSGWNILNNLSILNNNIDSLQYGLYFHVESTGGFNSRFQNLSINNNNITNTDLGIFFYDNLISTSSSMYQNININSNSVFNCSQNGISFYNLSDNPINKTDSVKLFNNVIHSCDSDGICLVTSDICISNRVAMHHFSIDQNSIYNNGKYGIELLNYPEIAQCSLRKTQLDHNIFSENSIHDNGNRGIKITDLADTINFNGFEFPIPILDTMFYSGGQYYISGHLNGEHLTSYKIEYFLNSTADTSGYGEGETFIGNDSIKTDSTGFANYIYAVASVAGACIAATATDYTHYNTSEFGNCLAINLVGINEYSPLINHLLIYPNPANESCLVKATNYRDAILNVYDYTGRIQQQLNFTEQTELATDKLLPGVYLVEIKSSGMNDLKAKLIVTR